MILMRAQLIFSQEFHHPKFIVKAKLIKPNSAPSQEQKLTWHLKSNLII
jgi:hypothetical protein